MKILVACECSGRVREAFRRLGHDAWSCDLKQAEDNSPYHIKGDALDQLDKGWDMLIAHPVCRYLSNSGSKHLYRDGRKANGKSPERWKLVQQAAQFYARFWDAPIKMICIENPVWHWAAALEVRKTCQSPHPKNRQWIQPWMFGHPETKATGLALKNLPPLEETDNVRELMLSLPRRERNRVHFEPPGKDREANRSRTFNGIAEAMALQWSEYAEPWGPSVSSNSAMPVGSRCQGPRPLPSGRQGVLL